jgi:hypothetical protein
MSAHPTACPECGAQMLLVRILPDRPGYEKRTSACPWCPQQEVTEVCCVNEMVARLAAKQHFSRYSK